MIRGWKSISGLALPVLAALLAFCPRTAAAETIRISGTGGAIATIRQLGDAFRTIHPDVRIVMLPSIGSSGGVKAVLAGRLDIGLCARPLTEEERARGAVDTKYARTPFVFGVNRSVTAVGLTLSDIAGIYSGKRSRWENRTRIRLVLRPESDSDTPILMRMSPEMRAAVGTALRRPGMIVAMTDQDAADAIEKTPSAFGALTLSIILSEKRGIRVLPVDGIVPSLKSVADGSYPYAKTFCMVTTKNRRDAVRRFIAFVRSPAGAAILAKYGQAAAW